MRSALLLALLLLLLPPALAQPRADPESLPGLVDALRADAPPGRAVADALRAIARAEGRDVPLAGLCPSLADAVAAHAARLGIAAPPLPPVPRALAEPLGCLLGGLHEADVAHDATFDGIAEGDLARSAGSEGSPGLDALLEGRSHARLLDAAIHVADLVDRALPALQALRGEPLPSLDVRPILRFEPTGATHYTHHYALIVDLEGDDAYDNNAGGVFVAVGSGIFEVDRESAWLYAPLPLGFQAAVGGDVQDADAVVSASLVMDLAGNDAYGLAKPAMFEDARFRCTAEDVVPVVGTIGAGIMGVGMLFDLGGDNAYLGRTQTQGAGHVLGVGVLYSGEGRDTFEAVRAAQGSGLLGGVGLLVDAGGDSNYRLRAPTGGVWNGDLRFCDDGARYAQGSAFDRRTGPGPAVWGVLADLGGDDRYAADTLAQGFGQGPGFGLLYERNGHDRYLAGNRAQGAAQGRSFDENPQALWGGGMGVLLDEAGDDTYVVTKWGQGWAAGAGATPLPGPNAQEVLAWASQRGGDEAAAALLDLGGADTYTQPGRADGASLVEGTLGVFRDA